MRALKNALIILSLFFTYQSSIAQIDPLEKVSWEFSVEQTNCEAYIIGKATIVDKWHIYAAHLPEGGFALPTVMELEKSDKYEIIGKLLEPKPEKVHDEILNEDLYLHSGTIAFKQKIKILSNKKFKIKGTYSFQTCDDIQCLPPYDDVFEVKVKGCKLDEESNNSEMSFVLNETVNTDSTEKIEEQATIEFPKNKTEQTTTKKSEDKLTDKSLLTIFFLAFLSGFAALLTPCVFPMIPMTVSFFTKQSKTRAAGIRNAVIYGLSIIIIYVLLGTIITAIFGSDALNALSTNVYFNIFFFLLLIIFAISFLGAFEIVLPSSWVNKADSASNRGGLIGIFFMAFTLALVSFSCTGPIVGTLLVQSASIGGMAPFVGMFGFSLALALPFGLFAAFPGWMNSLPKSGGWLNTVKVVLGFLELALAFKFLSNADLVMDWHLLEREVFLAIWIGVFGVLAMYLFGFIKLPHDSPIQHLSVGRTLFGTLVVIFVIYLIPGLWGAPLKLISGFPPPMEYSESPRGFGNTASTVDYIEGTKIVTKDISAFLDIEDGLAYAKKVGKPVLLDFTGKACVNCRRMEERVWGEPGVIEILKNDVVLVSLYVDDKRDLPEDEQFEVEENGKTVKITTIGKKWSHYQSSKYKVNTQPYYLILDENGNEVGNGSADYENHGNVDAFKEWLEEGLKLYGE
ncbi:MAG: thioredoxin family protein [Flavobacteriales bacterium]|nr:thioredoxin family protein [Flavobacteriales bacterium]MCW8911760.1 thioredoxin family protein [Flavobacteriales bacterium]MCW8937019.1 thioredoxin family protein [Flavobacteriales bacterium]MCW8968456.1 thioredoxin family protein [Flavobacteriales bacterium]MCW8989775.1 thioredoxin family protein [Flavobacteriales bacterium]